MALRKTPSFRLGLAIRIETSIANFNWNGEVDTKSSFRIPVLPASVLPMLSLPLSVFSGKQTHLAFVAHLSLSNLFLLLIPLRTCNKHTSATPSPPPSLDEFLSEASGGGSVYTRINTEMGGKCERCGGQTLVCLMCTTVNCRCAKIRLAYPEKFKVSSTHPCVGRLSKKYCKRIPLGRVGNERMAKFPWQHSLSLGPLGLSSQQRG